MARAFPPASLAVNENLVFLILVSPTYLLRLDSFIVLIVIVIVAIALLVADALAE